MKGKVICIKLHDGSTQLAVVLKRNGNTLTVKAYDGFLYDTCWDSQDSTGVYQAN
jgi:hypothetical protein